MTTQLFHTVIASHSKAQASVINSFKVLSNLQRLNVASARDLGFNRIYVRNFRVWGNSGTIPATVLMRVALKAVPQVVFSSAVELGDPVNDMVSMLPVYPGINNDVERLLCENRERQKFEEVTVTLTTISNAGVESAFTDYTNVVVEFVLQ